MADTSASSMVMVVTGPLQSRGDRELDPFELAQPEALVVCGYLRTAEERRALLARLRLAAGERVPQATTASEHAATLADAYARARRDGDDAEALACVVRWCASVHGLSYHAYSLKQGVEPYAAAFVLAFSELPAEALLYHVERGRDHVEGERRRVMDVFGWGATAED